MENQVIEDQPSQGGILAGKVARILPWTLRRSFEQKSRTFVAILRYDQKSRAFVAILYPRDEI